MLSIYSTADGSNNVRYTVAGSLVGGEILQGPLTDIKSITHEPALLRLDVLFFSLDKGMHGALRWEDNDRTLICPIEDRGYFDFEHWFGGWGNPKREGFTGNILLDMWAGSGDDRPWLFSLKFELTKQTR